MDSTIRFQELAGFVHFKAFFIQNDQIELNYYQAGLNEIGGININITTTSKDRRLDLLKEMKEEIKRCIKDCTE